MNWLDEKIYKKSLKEERVRGRIKKRTKLLFQKLLSSHDYTYEDIEKLAQYILQDLKLPLLPIQFRERRIRRGSIEEWGYVMVKNGKPKLIVLYTRTRVRGKRVAIKTLLRTLVHEITHVYDLTKLHLPASPHTKGFYSRMKDLLSKLEG